MNRYLALQAIVSIVLVLAAITPAGAGAQNAASPAPGLTVTGFGQASAPAETATVQLIIGAPSYGPPQPPRPGATPGTEEREAVAPVVRALVGAGIPQDAIDVIVGPYIGNLPTSGGPAQALIRFDISNPTALRLTDLVDAATMGAAEEGLLVNGVGVHLSVSDCAALERQAHDAAIADARERVDVQADLAGVTPGGLIAVRDVSFDPSSAAVIAGPMPLPSCWPVAHDGVPPGLYYSGTLTLDPTKEPVVTVHAQVEMTFAISGDGNATPAP